MRPSMRGTYELYQHQAPTAGSHLPGAVPEAPATIRAEKIGTDCSSTTAETPQKLATKGRTSMRESRHEPMAKRGNTTAHASSHLILPRTQPTHLHRPHQSAPFRGVKR